MKFKFSNSDNIQILFNKCSPELRTPQTTICKIEKNSSIFWNRAKVKTFDNTYDKYYIKYKALKNFMKTR